MKRLKHSLAAKIIAFILLIVSIPISVFSALGFAFLEEEGFYNGTASSFYETSHCQSLTANHAIDVASLYASGYSNADFARLYMPETSNFAFELYDYEDSEVLLAASAISEQYFFYSEEIYTFETYIEDYRPEEASPSAEMQTDDIFIGENGGEESSLEPIEKTYLVKTFLRDPIQPGDNYYRNYKTFSTLISIQGSLLTLAICFAVFSVLLLFFCLSAAGHKKGVDGIYLRFIDRIPFDAFICIAIGIVVICVSAFLSIYGSYQTLAIIADVLLCLCIESICLYTLITFAVRVKAGKWWRNTLLYKLIKLLIKGLRTVPLIAKNLFIFAVAIFIEILLMYMASAYYYDSFLPIAFLVLFNLGVLAFLCYTALTFQQIKKGGQSLAKGNLDAKIDTRYMLWDLRQHAENLNAIGDGLSTAVDERMKSERLKTELITNVSHDIKTPLTSIVNYADLLSKEHLQGKSKEYIAVLQRQAERLRKLTEDLVEASKAATGNLAVTLSPTNLSELLLQSFGEYEEKLAAQNLELVMVQPEASIHLLTDGRLLWRIIDNLLNNACKYSVPGTRVYVDVAQQDECVIISFKNISSEKLNISAEELVERFVRGDNSRSTEGSGLGLNIATSLSELLGGKLSLLVDGDLFKATVTLPLSK